MSDLPNPRIILPSLLAGPMVILFYGMTTFVNAIPHTMGPNWLKILSSPILVLVSLMVGFVPALVANGLGTIAMMALGSFSPLLRFPFLWPIVGGLSAGAVTHYLEMPAEWIFAFAASGAVSAMICRMRLA